MLVLRRDYRLNSPDQNVKSATKCATATASPAAGRRHLMDALACMQQCGSGPTRSGDGHVLHRCARSGSLFGAVDLLSKPLHTSHPMSGCVVIRRDLHSEASCGITLSNAE